MADKNSPSRSANMEKAEGDRWTSDPDTVEVADRYAEGIGDVTRPDQDVRDDVVSRTLPPGAARTPRNYDTTEQSE